MFGLIVLLVFGLYLLISVGVIYIAVRIAKKNDITAWKLGMPVALVMYLLVFWDQIPVYVMHKYYCAKDGGFVVYKTLEEWNTENPSEIEKLKLGVAPKPEGNRGSNLKKQWNKSWTTSRFYMLITSEKNFFHGIHRKEQIFVDSEKEKILARSIDYARGASGAVLGVGGDLREYFVLGLGERQCKIKDKSPSDLINDYRYSFVVKMRESK